MRPSVLLQYLVPQRLMSGAVRWATHARFGPWKNFLIDTIARTYGVDRTEALSADNADYEHFNAFFTRALKPGARPLDPDPWRGPVCGDAAELVRSNRLAHGGHPPQFEELQPEVDRLPGLRLDFGGG